MFHECFVFIYVILTMVPIAGHSIMILDEVNKSRQMMLKNTWVILFYVLRCVLYSGSKYSEPRSNGTFADRGSPAPRIRITSMRLSYQLVVKMFSVFHRKTIKDVKPINIATASCYDRWIMVIQAHRDQRKCQLHRYALYIFSCGVERRESCGTPRNALSHPTDSCLGSDCCIYVVINEFT